MLRTLARKLRCRHRAERSYTRYPGTEVERCTACGTTWLTFEPGTRIRVWLWPR